MSELTISRLLRPVGDGEQEYLRDESRTVGHADSISFPKSEQEVCALLRALSAAGVPVTVQGARTGLTAAAVPFGGHAMNLSRMNRVTGLGRTPEGGFTVRVQPGLALSELRKLLGDLRFDTAGWDDASLDTLNALRAAPEQTFPPDPTESTASVGGMVCCNASGARTYRYGPTRRYVRALRVALSDGDLLVLRRGALHAAGHTLTLTTAQGRRITVPVPHYRMPDVKNTSGYFAAPDMDAIDLFIGANGTLGVVTEIEFDLLPLDGAVFGINCLLDSEDRALALVMALRGRPGLESLAALEFFDGDALDILTAQKRAAGAFSALPDIPAHVRAAVYAELRAPDADTATEALFLLGDTLREIGGHEQDTWVARTAADRDRLLFFRHAVPESVNMLIDQRRKLDPVITKLGTDMAVPDAHLRDVMALYRSGLRAEGLQSAVWGHIGNNHLHVNILPHNADEYARGKALYAAWAREIAAMGGSVASEHGVGKIKASMLPLMYTPAELDEMAAVKTALDPQWLLGRGNIFEAREVRS